MASLTGFNVRFTPCWRMSLFALLVILLFTRLGFWQLQRADEKKQMLSAHQEYAKQAPILWQANSHLPPQYQQIAVEGYFLPSILLLDNQHYQHQFGYHMLAPLILSNGQVILVNRGWIAGDVTRQTLPKVDMPTGTVKIVGSVYYPSTKNWSLGPIIEKKQDNLAVIELIDPHVIGQFLHKSVYPFTIRLGEHEAGGYVREWPVVAMPPQRHNAYAVQWFAMAAILLILMFMRNISVTVKKTT